MPYEPPPDLASLSLVELAALVETRKRPPVSQWNPSSVGDSEMRIAADGRWYHQGGEITRPAMIRAFSSLLRREADGSFALVTPSQKLAIAVDDAPFIAVEMEAKDDALLFRLNSDDLVIAGADHPLRLAGSADEPAVYLMVRDGLEARLNRRCWLDLAELALASPDLSVVSRGFTLSLAGMAS